MRISMPDSGKLWLYVSMVILLTSFAISKGSAAEATGIGAYLKQVPNTSIVNWVIFGSTDPIAKNAKVTITSRLGDWTGYTNDKGYFTIELLGATYPAMVPGDEISITIGGDTVAYTLPEVLDPTSSDNGGGGGGFWGWLKKLLNSLF